MITEQVHLEETLERTINEALGVANNVRDEALRFLDFIAKRLDSFKPKEDEKVSINIQTLKIKFGKKYVVPVNIKVFYFRSKRDMEEYRCQIPYNNPFYSKDNKCITIELDVVDGNFDVDLFLDFIQHEIHHAYQYYLKHKNGVEPKPNSENYQKAIQLLSFPDKEERGAATAVYLYGTHELSAYENGLYAVLLQNFKTKNKPVTNVIHASNFYRLYKNVVDFQNSLINGGDLPFFFRNSINLTKEEVLKMCGKVIKKSQDIMAKAVAKAKFDYDDWVKEQRMTNSDPYDNKVLKPLKNAFINF